MRRKSDSHKLARNLINVKNVRCAVMNHGRKYKPVAIQKFMDTHKVHVGQWHCCECEQT